MRSNSNTYGYIDSYRDGNRYSYSNCDVYCNGHRNSDSYSHCDRNA
jgi:hypothetical protein